MTTVVFLHRVGDPPPVIQGLMDKLKEVADQFGYVEVFHLCMQSTTCSTEATVPAVTKKLPRCHPSEIQNSCF